MRASQPVAERGVTDAQREPTETEGNEYDVEHDPLQVGGTDSGSGLFDRKAMRPAGAAYMDFIVAGPRPGV
jgi:hypothetical protein